MSENTTAVVTDLSAAELAEVRKVAARWADGGSASAERAAKRAHLTYSQAAFARTVDAAYATGYAVAAGTLGDGLEWARALGVNSKGIVTKWRALGKCLVVAKVDPTSHLYYVLQAKRATEDEAVKAVLKQDTFTVADLAKAVDVKRNADGSLKAPASKGARAGNQADEKKAAALAEAEKVAGLSVKDQIDVALKVLKSIMADSKCSVDQIEAIETRVGQMIRAEKALRAKDAAKNGATPAAVAAKKAAAPAA